MVLFLAPVQSERSRFPILIRARSTSAWASRRFAETHRMATEFINRLMQEKPGNALVLRTRARSRVFGFTQRTPILSTSQHRDTFGEQMNNAAFTAAKTEARPGNECFTKATRLVPVIRSWTQRIPVFSMPVCGKSIESHGRSRVVVLRAV